jgi:4-phytase/acid phosphatase
MMKTLVLILAALFSAGAVSLATPALADQPSRLTMVLVMSRHGVRSPTHPSELNAYAAQPWPTWAGVKAGYLTARGAVLMRQYGAYYRRSYGTQLAFTAGTCPPAGSVFIWADVDQRTKATGAAIAQGFAPGCRISVGSVTGDNDSLFDPLPGVGTVNKAESNASVLGMVGGNFNGVVQANGATFATMERILGCTNASRCKSIAAQPTYITNDGDGGLASLNGGLDMAGDVGENLLLEYVDGHPNVGWGRVDHATILELMQLSVLGKQLEHNRYGARAHSSNIMAHILQTLQEGATGQAVSGTRIPPSTKFIFLSGHDTQLSELSSMLGLSWLVKGDVRNDTPPGSALVFEVRQSTSGGAFVRTYYSAQTLDSMRALHGENPQRVPVYVPGCPGYDCPIDTFASVVNAAIDPTFVTNW